MKTIAFNATLLVTALAASMALGTALANASDDDVACSNAPQSEWRTPDDVKAATEAQGYEVSRVKIEGGCFEVYARDKTGIRAELYVDPVSLKIMRVKDKS